ncbi:MAG: UDP-N-acetylmuramoyl-L-alanine--D-glutamate ligase [Actinomycetota bacterium]|nr:UDP-N-acetylmuramoyl-L-alanine--D-glutamate ligase [Actinomycetota bacterium]
MSGRPPLPPGPYLVVGLARSGAAAARMLAAHGEVIGVDSGRPEVDLPGAELHLGETGLELLDRAVTVVKSPGVAREAPVVAAAIERGMEVTGELELAWRLLSNRFVAVTGTNGKTTTVELLGEMFRAADLPVAVAGNVGTPLASLVGRLEEDATVVCEASSFQLEDSSAFAPECAVLLNLEPDHLDRHGDFERYREAKLRIFANQAETGTAVMPEDLDRDPFSLGDVRLRGDHNRQNARAAALAAAAMGVPDEAIRRALASFSGVPHRMEEVAEVDGVLYVNDSKATNVASATRGIEAFEGGVHVILGGSLKGGGFTGLREAVAARCEGAYLIGEAAQELESDLQGTVDLHRSGILDTAVAAASTAAAPGEVVLLSPACASWDAFRDYEHRGERFRELVRAGG